MGCGTGPQIFNMLLGDCDDQTYLETTKSCYFQKSIPVLKCYNSKSLEKIMCVCVHVQLCLILCDPRDCDPTGPSEHGIYQARILEWVAIS